MMQKGKQALITKGMIICCVLIESGIMRCIVKVSMPVLAPEVNKV